MKEELGLIKEELAKAATVRAQVVPHRAAEPRACGAYDVETPPKWIKELLPNEEELVDPFTDRPDGATPHASDTEEPAAGEDKLIGLADLVVGELPTAPWQLNPYARESASWLAAAQRRHQHRRRSNALLGVAAVDLSGPHEPTPMVGQKIGHKPGHYFVVLTIEVDQVTGYKSTQMQTEAPEESQLTSGDGSAPPKLGDTEQPDAQVETAEDKKLPRLPLVYVDIINQKADAAAATERLLAQVQDEHGHLPTRAVFRLHTDRGQEFCPHSLERYCEAHGIRRTTTAGYDPSSSGAGEQAVFWVH